jgi:hypothetical protein
MIHEQRLLDQLSAAPAERFDGEAYRTTSLGADPLAPSISGGRWSPPQDGSTEVSVLYTSLDRDGSLAEVVAYLVQLSPPPRANALKITRLGVSTARTLRLVRARLEDFGVDMRHFGERDYARTQQIGAAIAFLEFDGLIAPSARWACDNLMVFTANHSTSERLEAIDDEKVDWRTWAIERQLYKEQSGRAT